MQIQPYSVCDAGCVREIISHSINFAPEYVQGTGIKNDDLEYFDDSFVSNNNGGSAHIVKDTSGNVVAFLTTLNIVKKTGNMIIYITGFYVRDNEDKYQLALRIIDDFVAITTPQSILCINLHPSARSLCEFWEKEGFSYSPTYSVFTNADGDSVSSYIYDV